MEVRPSKQVFCPHQGNARQRSNSLRVLTPSKGYMSIQQAGDQGESFHQKLNPANFGLYRTVRKLNLYCLDTRSMAICYGSPKQTKTMHSPTIVLGQIEKIGTLC